MRKTVLLSSFAVFAAFSSSALAADVVKSDFCAVSGFNGKVALEGGAWDQDNYGDNSVFDGIASFTMPLGCQFGLQVDAGAGTFGDADAVGIGGHLFTRDPNSYLLGVHGTYESWNFDSPNTDVDIFRIGAEAEAYLGNVSLEAWAGIQDSDNSGAEGFAKLTAALYATDDLRLSIAWHQSGDFSTGVAAAEWQLPDMPLSLTASAEFGEDDYMAITGGVKFYFGGTQKSLIDRHRNDDPADGLFNFTGATAAGAACQATTLNIGSIPQKLMYENPLADPMEPVCGTPSEK